MSQNDAPSKNDRPLPGHETQSDEMACPKCGRFVGAATKCPYCGAKVEKRMSLVVIRWAAVLLSTVGLFLLYLMAKTHEPERIQIGDIETTMNFGAVRLVGEVKNNPRPFKNGNGMSFYVSDETGSIIVFVDQTQRKTMIAEDLVPRKGDGIDFIVQLQASSSGNSARIRGLGPDSFKLTRADGTPARAPSSPGRPAAAQKDLGPAVPFSSVDESLVGNSITLEGTVASIQEPPADSKRPYVLTLSDGSETLDVKLWADQYLQLVDPKSLPGAAVRVKAAVKLYRGKVDLSLKKGSDLQRAAPAGARVGGGETSLSAITPEMAGQTVTVRGSVAKVSPPKSEKAPWTVTLADPAPGAKVSVVYWDKAREAFVRQPAEGDLFEFTGEVNVYKGNLQLKVTSGAKAKPLDGESASAPAERTAPVSRKPPVPVAEVTAEKLGRYVTVEGGLSDAVDLEGKGTSYKLTDDSGSIQVVFWNSTVPADLQKKAAAAPRVRVNGKVKEYKGVIQVVPRANGVEVRE